MAIATDPLLNSAPELKPRAPAAKAPSAAAEPRKNEASSFANVYARERQAKAAERQDAVAKNRQEQRPDETARPTDGDTAVAAKDAEVADSGKALPDDEADPGTPDPALLLAMSGQLPAAEGETDAAQLTAQDADPALLLGFSGVSLSGSGPASLTEASHDPQVDALNEANNLGLTLGLDGKPQLGPSAQANAAAAQQAGSGKAPDFAAAMAALGEPGKSQDQLQLEAELPGSDLGEGLGEGQDSAVGEVRNDALVSRLTTLNHAIQQVQPAPRAAEIPGQPLSLQQGNISEALVDKVMWLSSQNLKSAEIQLHPADLGRLDVRINMVDDQAQVTFSSPHAGVRDALEGQMHRLREMFTQQGMNMDANVSDQSLNRGWQGQQQGQSDSGRGASPFRGGTERFGGDEEVTLGVSEIRSNAGGGGRSLVDYYA
ncbi:flagellar hook-length control protein FliK [Pseudomonas sp. UL073]|uniref:Flagellar hook-length control protein FliK n=1 Tax=Zestomonas insulae TaxID=2809017 RepID=A0ABS2I9A1_9GAMM|nr:flagellar hook-length control protein FliK [Pseudomonas insulae]MBM7059552.1 flagellar hook-length control protein FliK [Pseudomonas insulae]